MAKQLHARAWLLLLLGWISIIHANAQGYLKADGKKIVNGQGEEVILRGMGLGGWMLQEGYMLRTGDVAGQQHVIRAKIQELIGPEKTADFYSAWLSNHTRKVDIDSMAAWGFNSVRLAMHYNLYTLPVEQEPVKGQNTWLEQGFAMTDSLLAWCKANNMYLILDLHAAPGGQGNDLNISDRDPNLPSLWESEENQQKTVALWRKLAERYADEPWLGAYDIINEPNWGFTDPADKNGCNEKQNEPLRKLMVDITKAIREVDQKHIIIIEGNCWGNNYSGVLPTWDNNMVLSFHKYWNYNNQEAIQGWLEHRDKYNVPIWLGETGENSNVWFTQAISLVERNGIGWCWWPLKKMGFNNPLEVKVDPGYQKILDFWKGKGPKPEAAEAYQALMQQAENTKLENCLYHKGVVDAMFRQVQTTETKPFNSNAVTAGTTLHAVDYDLGRNGYAYFDKDTANYYISTGGGRTPWNKGHVYRNDGVDIEDGPDGYYVSSFEEGEWLQYTLTVPKKGNYHLRLWVAADHKNGKVAVLPNGTETPKAIAVPNTGGTENWQAVHIENVPLMQGKNVLRVRAVSGEFNLRSIQFEKGGKAVKRKSGLKSGK
ncbi:cellulase family glycosylhydrolase [Pontibacter anaerobius]|uniref:Cellulase family glycosylhydrolase n=1 Tax=Pontibacter anaerobius TaxID=2993940 RepID=A0ABT3REH9_9BACT|nr:cellulase family glycosylhydrolase [Pontibacter anaerobius]MCX2739921.1 cellulase family glycosylhydrolase [Pontibacter anaerobius]